MSAIKYTISEGTKPGALEVKFEAKPEAATREALKALKFRWNGAKGVWYGFASSEVVTAALGGQPVQASESPAARVPELEPIRIYYNGLKVGSGKLIRCGFSLNCSEDADTVGMYAKNYEDLPRGYAFGVMNDTDIMTDYFDNDHARVTAAHPLYKYVRYAAMKAQARLDRDYCESLRESIEKAEDRERWPGQLETLKRDLARRLAFLAEFDATADPGQPTAADLIAVEDLIRAKQEAAEQERKAEEERERAAFEAKKNNGRALIAAEIAAHPLQDNAPAFVLHWSEHPAFYEWNDKEGAEALRMSLTAADHIITALDKENAPKCGYDKTRFHIEYTDPDTGETTTYQNRYDLGDDLGGLWAELKAVNPDFADYLEALDISAELGAEEREATPNAYIIYSLRRVRQENNKEWWINSSDGYPCKDWSAVEAVKDWYSQEGKARRALMEHSAWAD